MRSASLFAVAVTLVVAVAARAQEAAPPVDEIIKKSNHAAYYQGKDGRALVTMTIKDSQGRTRTRQFTILRKDVGDADGDQMFYVYFHEPADVKKMVFMVHKHLAGDDDRWLYLPNLDLVKRIASTDKRTSFVGSDFFYEDVSGRNIADDTHELVDTTKNYYVLKNTPKNPDTVEFSYYKMYVHKPTSVPIKVEFFDKNGALYRVYQALKVPEVQGFRSVTKASMKDLRTGSETINDYADVAYDAGLPEDIFSERYLKAPPAQYLK